MSFVAHVRLLFSKKALKGDLGQTVLSKSIQDVIASVEAPKKPDSLSFYFSSDHELKIRWDEKLAFESAIEVINAGGSLLDAAEHATKGARVSSETVRWLL